MKIYLAGSCSKEDRHFMTSVAEELREKGYEVYCPFELKIPNAWDYTQECWARMVFDKDIAAINECDFVVMISDGRHSTAGTNWEQGYAYAKQKPIFVFQKSIDETSLMTYCGCRWFVNLVQHIGCSTYIADFPYERFIKTSWCGNTNKCETILT